MGTIIELEGFLNFLIFCRFRGRILTQPSSTPLASFNIISLDEPYSPMSSNENSIGPHGDKDDWAVFLQKVGKLDNIVVIIFRSFTIPIKL